MILQLLDLEQIQQDCRQKRAKEWLTKFEYNLRTKLSSQNKIAVMAALLESLLPHLALLQSYSRFHEKDKT